MSTKNWLITRKVVALKAPALLPTTRSKSEIMDEIWLQCIQKVALAEIVTQAVVKEPQESRNIRIVFRLVPRLPVLRRTKISIMPMASADCLSST